MGLVVYPVFRTPGASASRRTTGEFLAREFAELDRIACEYGLKGITDFADQRPVPEDFDGPPWELEELIGPCEDWFSAADGQAAFLRLASLIRAHSAVADRLKSPDAVIEELEDLAQIVGEASESGSEFRLNLS